MNYDKPAKSPGITVACDLGPLDVTLTIEGAVDMVGHAVKLEDADGRCWYGVVGADGKALMVRADAQRCDDALRKILRTY